MSDALEKARAKRAEMVAAGVKPTFTVKFTGEEAEILKVAAMKTDAIENTSARDYVKTVVLTQATLDAAKPARVRTTKTAEQLEEEAAKILARAAALKAQGT